MIISLHKACNRDERPPLQMSRDRVRERQPDVLLLYVTGRVRRLTLLYSQQKDLMLFIINMESAPKHSAIHF